jgi:nucleoside-diphosphate-sugar epimerase
MKIAVLGASGFVGSRAVEYFTLTGQAEVRCIVRRYAGLVRSARFAMDWRLADALDEEELLKAFSGCDFVLQTIMGDEAMMAGCAGPAYRAAERAGVRRIVHLSSAAVYQRNFQKLVDETTPLVPRRLDGYASAKLKAETELLRLARTGRTGVVVLRPSIIIGPRSGWVLNPARQLLDGDAFLGDGGPGFANTIYVDNLLAATLLAFQNEKAAGEVFCVGDAESLTWAEYYLQLADLLGVPASRIRSASAPPSPRFHALNKMRGVQRLRTSAPYQAASILAPKALKNLLHRKSGHTAPPTPSPAAAATETTPHLSAETVSLHTTPWRLSSAKARSQLGFSPPVSLAEGLRKSVEWLRFAGWR